jgi:phosphoribosylglycinamide formyltransferase-1
MNSLVILISGRGSNMQAIVEAAERERWPARIAAVISNRPDAEGLQWAMRRGISTRSVDHKAYSSREDFDAALASCIEEFRPRAVVLAGFMRILTAGFVRRFEGRLVNIHPSLLPAFPGLHTHRQALAQGVKIHGCSVHFVTPELDHGPIVAQAAVPVFDADTELSLAERVLVEEHRLYPRAVRWLVEDRLVVENGIVRVKEANEGDAGAPLQSNLAEVNMTDRNNR